MTNPLLKFSKYVSLNFYQKTILQRFGVVSKILNFYCETAVLLGTNLLFNTEKWNE